METSPTRPNPYIGPRAFQTGEKLYGRDLELGTLVNLLIAERIVLLHSPSGAGKSSLIQAGLMPSMEAQGFQVLPPVRINLEPPAGLRDDPYFNRFIYSALVSLQESLPESERSPVAALAQMTLDDCLQHCFFPVKENADGQAGGQVLIFDQFEEILTIEPNKRAEKAAFFNQLGQALRTRDRWALFAIREDYLAALSPYLRPIPTRFRTTFRLDLLGKDAAGQAIQQPAQQAGVDFTAEAVAKLVDDLRRVLVQRPDGSLESQLGLSVEPVQLQVVCYRLWERLPEGITKILPAEIESVGDVDAALAGYYAERVAAVAAQTGSGERAIRDWFEHRLITPQGIRGQVLMGQDRSEGLDNRAIRLLENAHLLRAEKRGGATWFELAHDRLIAPVRNDNAAWFQQHLTLFQRQAFLWENEKRPASLLLREQDLAEAEAWAQAHNAELKEVERDFLAASLEQRTREAETRQLAEAQQTAASERQRAELEARTARQLRRLTRWITVALVVAILATVAAGFFWQRSELNRSFAEELRATSDYVAGVNQVYAATNQAAAATAQDARGQAVEQAQVAEAASVQERALRATADAASELANAQKATAEFNEQQAGLSASEARAQSALAFSRQLASQSAGYLESQYDLSLLLAVEAYHAADTLEARSVLLDGLQVGLEQTANPYGRPIPPEDNAIVSVALSPDGERLAFGSGEGKVIIWNYRKEAIEYSLQVHQNIVWGVAFSPDGKTIASAGDDSSIHLLDVASGKETGQIFPGNKVTSVTWDPAGGRLAASVGPRVMIWDLADLRNPAADQNLQVDVNQVAWSPDGRMLAAATSFPNITILDPDNQGIVNLTLTGSATQPGHTKKVNSVAWSADSRLLASGGADNMVYVWDIAKGEAVAGPLKGHFNEVQAVAISHDKAILASGSKDGAIILWDLRTYQPFGLPLTIHGSDVNDLAFLPVSGRNLLASASRDKTVKLEEVITEQPLRAVLASIAGRVLALAADPNDALQAAGLQENSVTLWNVRGNIQSPAFPGQGAPTSAALLRDGTRLAVGYDTGRIELFEPATGRSVGTLESPDGPVTALAFSPDGGSLASAGCTGTGLGGDRLLCKQSQVRLWDIAGGAPLGDPLQGHPDFVFALAFSPDGKLLATGGQDKTIRLWDLGTGEAAGLPLNRHLDSVTSLAFSPDGALLASGSLDNTLILWDTATNQPVGDPLLGSPGSALALAFNPQSRFIYAGYPDGSVLSWDIDFEAWAQRACGLAGRNLTSQEWGQFFHTQDLSYRPTCEQYPGGEAAGAVTPTPTPSAAATPTP